MLIKTILSWMRLQRRLSLAERRCLRADQALLRSMDRIEGLKGELESLQTELSQGMRQLELDTRTYEEALAALRAQIEVAEEITIPEMAAAHKLVLTRIDADTAIQVRRQTVPIQGE